MTALHYLSTGVNGPGGTQRLNEGKYKGGHCLNKRCK